MTDLNQVKADVQQAATSAEATVKKVETEASADVATAKADASSAETVIESHWPAIAGVILGIVVIAFLIHSCS